MLTYISDMQHYADMFSGVGGLNVPMFIALRRFTVLITIGLEVWWYKKKHTKVAYGKLIGLGINVFNPVGKYRLFQQDCWQ